MRRYHLHKALREADLSLLEESAALAGVALLVAGLIAAAAGNTAGGLARGLGTVGLAAFAACACSRALRRYRAGAGAALPRSVARVHVRARPSRVFSAVTAALALGLPPAAAVALLVAVPWGWLAVAGVLLLGCVGLLLTWLGETRRGDEPYRPSHTAAAELLERLCMRADMPAPRLAVAPGPVATAWTAGGRIHVTRPLLKLLDDRELEAVLAHELVHLAHRDAAAMEICSAPSRVLLAVSGTMTQRLVRWLRNPAMSFPVVDWIPQLMAVVSVFVVPPSFLIGWTSRLSVLGISRAREFAADAGAAALTGRPSALASALLKLERQTEWAPRADLREVEPIAVLCIVGARSRLGRAFSTHPPTAARVQRLRELELRIQGR